MIDFCCACISDECCGCGHECDLTPEEIAENIRVSDETNDVMFSLEIGEKKQVPSTSKWVTRFSEKHYGMCDA